MPLSFTTRNQARRIVVKLGSQILLDHQGRLAVDRLAGYVQQCAALREEGRQVMVVSSGAVSLGRQQLGAAALPLEADLQQRVCAAIGQSQMVNMYRQLFQHYGCMVGQVLINPQDFSERWRYRNAQKTLNALLELGVVPIINENDTLSDSGSPDGVTPESLTAQPPNSFKAVSFGDNDQLASLVTFMTQADMMILLSNVDGLYTSNPFTDPTARRIPWVRDLKELDQISMEGKSTAGRGGMSSKVHAMETASLSGAACVLTSGLRPGAISAVLSPGCTENDFPGTFVEPQPQAEYPRGLRRWIGLSSGYHGILRINNGARDAIRHGGASLLAVGITQVLGTFERQQVISIHDEAGQEIGRGISAFSSAELHKLAGHSSRDFGRLLQTQDPLPDEVVHRDKLFVF